MSDLLFIGLVFGGYYYLSTSEIRKKNKTREILYKEYEEIFD